jgi:hypothetical protein
MPTLLVIVKIVFAIRLNSGLELFLQVLELFRFRIPINVERFDFRSQEVIGRFQVPPNAAPRCCSRK